MKSLEYLLFDKPKTTDDCFDLSYKIPFIMVKVTVEVEEIVTEMYVMKRFLALFTWHFAHQENAIKTVSDCGGCISWDSDEKIRNNIYKADKRLQTIINKIEKQHIPVISDNVTFDSLHLF